MSARTREVVVAGDEQPALPRRDRLRRRERPDPGVAPGARRGGREGRAVRVRAVLDQEDALGTAESAIRSTSNAMWPPMCTRNAARGRCLRALARNRRTTRRGRLDCDRRTPPPHPPPVPTSGVAMNVFDGQSTVSPRTPANASAAIAAPDQLLDRDCRQPVPALPGGLECLHERTLRPALRIRCLIPNRADAHDRADRSRSRRFPDLGGEPVASSRAYCRGRGPPARPLSL